MFSGPAFVGFSVAALPEQALDNILRDQEVELVEVNQVAHASQTVPSWGLDRINDCDIPADNTSTQVDASDVRVYILDTGIKSDHEDFGTRVDATCGAFYSKGKATTEDGDGHGTHVASTACGNTYGVARGCTMCPVKVLSDQGSGSYDDIISGVNFVVENCNGRKCVANMSLGGGTSAALNNAVNAAVESGVPFVVAAGNESTDACTKSPASAKNAITVGATDVNDNPASFTNYGTCVDVYGPGVGISAAWIRSTTDTNTISGTSMASPRKSLKVSMLMAFESNKHRVSSLLFPNAVFIVSQMSPVLLPFSCSKM